MEREGFIALAKGTQRGQQADQSRVQAIAP